MQLKLEQFIFTKPKSKFICPLGYGWIHLSNIELQGQNPRDLDHTYSQLRLLCNIDKLRHTVFCKEWVKMIF